MFAVRAGHARGSGSSGTERSSRVARTGSCTSGCASFAPVGPSEFQHFAIFEPGGIICCLRTLAEDVSAGAPSKRAQTGALFPSAVLCIAVCFLFGAASTPPAAATDAVCSAYAATTGNDSNPGTLAQPYRTVQHLAGTLSAGQTGCLLGGTFDGPVALASGGTVGNPITITSAPGYRATVHGALFVRDTANDVVISDLVLNGQSSTPRASPQINGDRVTLRGNDITNEHTDICVLLGPGFEEGDGRAVDAVIDRNRIHDCGRLPRTGHDHGIYVEGADNARITDNAIYDNADYGIHLYPDSDGATILNNVLDGSGRGLIFAGERAGGEYPSPYSSDNNRAESNIITNSTVRWNIESWWGGPTGSGNVARRNCVWNGAMGNINVARGGVALEANVEADPMYVDRLAKDFRLSAGSPCAAMRNQSVPTVALTEPGDGGAVKGSVHLAAEAADDGGVAKVEFIVRDRVLAVDATAPYEATWDTTGVPDGPVLVAARVTDSGGGTAISHSAVVKVDTTPPDPPNVDSGPPSPSSSGTAAFAFSGLESGLTFLCRLDGGAFSPCTSPAEYSALPEGAHGFEVKARDGAGNESAPAAATWAIDLAPPGAALAKVAIGQFQNPIFLTAPPDDPSRLFVVERGGRIQIVRNGEKLATPFLDLSSEVSTGGERGLFSMAFAPDYAASGRFYVDYTDLDGDIRVEEFTRSGENPDQANPASRRLVLTQEHSGSAYHNGGQVQFGADGYLYVSIGDGSTCLGCKSQDLATWLGKILRIDPSQSGEQPYTVPADNPFLALGGASREIYALGLRNPWRFSFDRANGDLVIGDVGQGRREEIDFTPGGTGRGANFGWNCWEGTLENTSCDPPGYVPPVLERAHGAGGCSMTGGYVVRDPSLLSLYGRYLYGDYCSDDILRSAVLGVPAASDDGATTLVVDSLASFGEDACGRVYALSLGDGNVYRIQSGSPAPCLPPSVAIADATVTEGDAGTVEATFRVTLFAARAVPVAVRYRTTADTATAGDDYTSANGMLTFAPGERSKTVTVPVHGDALPEAAEIFFVDLTNPGNAAIADASGVGTVVDDDGNYAPVASDDGLAIEEAAVGGVDVLANDKDPDGDALVVTTLTPAAANGVVACAAAGRCTYTPRTGFSGSDRFQYSVSDGRGGTATAAVAVTVAALPRPGISIGRAQTREGNSGAVAADFTVSLSAAAPRPVGVRYTTADGSATAGADYEAASGLLIFPPGATTGTIAVRVRGDVVDEPDETFAVRLSDAANATIAVGEATGMIVDDDGPARRKAAGGPAVAVKSRRLTPSAAGFVMLRVAAPATARGRIVGHAILDALVSPRASAAVAPHAKTQRVRLGRVPLRLRPGRAATLRMRISARGMRLLRRAGRLRGQVTIVARDASRRTGRTRATVTVDAPPRRA